MKKYPVAKFRVRVYDVRTCKLVDEDFYNNKYDLWLGLFGMGNQYEHHRYTVEISKRDTSRLDCWKPVAEF